ncbi:asparagine synthase-related protein [Georgenia sp. MJ170]|uniref:asparagine synthase-related protein n=1 Tax=Georgenia sunbinii TaxID=3117728 RepID=UPI002F2629A8
MGQPLAESSGGLPQTELRDATCGARVALREVLRNIIVAGPVFVSFSGGRDSSAVLAVAVGVAREVGADLPIPVIYRYPGDHNANEDEWQELVLRHIGVTEQVVLEITDQQRLLGTRAQESMARRGLVWPASLNLQHEMYSVVSGGTLLTGEGGDELLSGRRSAPVARLRRTFQRRQRPGRHELRAAARSMLPQRATARSEAERVQAAVAPWLRGSAREEFLETVAEDLIEPLRWDRSIRHAATLRPVARAIYHNLDLVARDYDVDLIHPLLAPEFVSAWIRDGGMLGFTGRTVAMRHLFSDVLPEKVLSRSDKAFFNASRVGAVEHRFARGWDGGGLDLEYVDPEVLRRAWLSPELLGPGYTALMAAWMASEGLPLEGPQR